ncbi:glycosyltransferase family 4 protein [Streptomyces sp. NPDC056835]|uniref:glycosyltransferase family 4 protein n=1 Tax=Streptomyces sp. NPDC056835 TaxID=3345956 RepID=UPI0036C777BF
MVSRPEQPRALRRNGGTADGPPTVRPVGLVTNDGRSRVGRPGQRPGQDPERWRQVRVLQVLGPHVNVPPVVYGGTERVAESLAVELTGLGVEVTTFSVGTSSPTGRLAFHFEEPRTSSGKNGKASWDRVDDVIQAGKAFAMSGDFDVVHNHTEYGVPFAGICNTPTVTTLHGYAAEGTGLERIVNNFPDAGYVTISERQRSLCPHLRVLATVPNCIPEDVVGAKARATPGGAYLVHLARISAAKGSDLAIEAARSAGIPLVLAGPVFRSDKEFFESKIKPYLDGVSVDYVGVVSGEAKTSLLRDALATLAPIQWDELFGLSIVESMAVGTPVIAFRKGAFPEVVEESVTGFVVDDVRAMRAAIEQVGALDRGLCAAAARGRFAPSAMAKSYVQVYERLLG